MLKVNRKIPLLGASFRIQLSKKRKKCPQLSDRAGVKVKQMKTTIFGMLGCVLDHPHMEKYSTSSTHQGSLWSYRHLRAGRTNITNKQNKIKNKSCYDRCRQGKRKHTSFSVWLDVSRPHPENGTVFRVVALTDPPDTMTHYQTRGSLCICVASP